MNYIYKNGQQVGTVRQGDALALLYAEDHRFDLIFADPPFNAGKVYGSGQHSDKLPDVDYVGWCNHWITAAAQLLNDGGTFWLMNETRWIGHMMVALEDQGLTFVNLVSWVYTNPTPASRKFQKTWRPIAVFAKGEPKTWHAAPPMERETLYFNPKRREKGVPFVHDVWADIPKLVGGFLAQPELQTKPNGQFAHIAQMPRALADRIILTATDPGDSVLDIFAGSGTVLESAVLNGREVVGYEREPEYCQLIEKRLSALLPALV